MKWWVLPQSFHVVVDDWLMVGDWWLVIGEDVHELHTENRCCYWKKSMQLTQHVNQLSSLFDLNQSVQSSLHSFLYFAWFVSSIQWNLSMSASMMSCSPLSNIGGLNSTNWLPHSCNWQDPWCYLHWRNHLLPPFSQVIVGQVQWWWMRVLLVCVKKWPKWLVNRLLSDCGVVFSSVVVDLLKVNSSFHA